MREYGDLPRWRSLTALGTTAIVLVLGFTYAIAPVKRYISDRYVERGDSYFSMLQFKEADEEYSQALKLNPAQATADTNLQLVHATEHDLRVGLPFFREHHLNAVVRLLDEALQPYVTPKDSLTEGVKLFAAEQYQYARYPLERAVQLDPSYAEAWNYLGLTYQELAKQDVDKQKLADDAFKKRDELSVKYIH